MESTFFIYDPLKRENYGTSFILALTVSSDSLSKITDSTFIDEDKKFRYKFARFKYVEIFLTAAHVLKNMEGDYAHLVLRSKNGDAFQTFDYPIRIRENGQPLWTQLNDVDVAAMIVSLPENSVYSVLDIGNLMTGKQLNHIELNTGSDLLCLGFPYTTPSDNGYFPILRSGRYASYRNNYSLNSDNFLFDFRIYPGNSGGPVFVDLNLTTGGSGGKETIIQGAGLIGMVSEQLKSTNKEKNIIEVAKVIKGEFIFKTILELRYSSSLVKQYDSEK